MSVMLVVCGGIAIAGFVLALAFLPARSHSPATAPARTSTSIADTGAQGAESVHAASPGR
jgi:hypothetical protein